MLRDAAAQQTFIGEVDDLYLALAVGACQGIDPDLLDALTPGF